MKRVLWVVVLLALAAGGAWWHQGMPMPGKPAATTAATGDASGTAPPPDGPPRPGPGTGGGPDGPSPPPAGGRRGQNGEAARVAVATVEKRDVPVMVSGLGVVTALKQATIKPQVDGRLLQIHFREGQPVAKDEPLATIDPRPFEATLRKAEADVLQNQAQLTLARQTLDRQKMLGARDIASRETIETAQAKVLQTEAAVAAAQATAERARIDLDHTTVRAPWDGLAGMRVVDEGNMVRTGDAGGLVVLTQVDPIAVVFTLPADALPAAARATGAAKRAVSLLARDRKTEVATGELLAVDNLIDQNTNAIKLKAVFANPERALWPGQFVTARLVVETLPDAVTVPAAAVQRNADGAFAFVVKRGEKGAVAELRAVDVALVQNELAVIRTGLTPGERVVTEGQYKLKNGSPIVPQGEGGKPAAVAAGRDRS